MTDDWSLKKKYYRWKEWNEGWYTVLQDDEDTAKYYTWIGEDDIEQTLYDADDVKTLREKLIEDITGYVTDELHHEKSLNNHMNYVIKEIINKRFGVDED